jgi:hypothetical protein
MNTPANKSPEGNPEDPKVTALGGEVITNKDDADKVLNKDGAVADTDGIQEALTESEPTLDVTAGTDVTTDHGTAGSETGEEEVF